MCLVTVCTVGVGPSLHVDPGFLLSRRPAVATGHQNTVSGQRCQARLPRALRVVAQVLRAHVGDVGVTSKATVTREAIPGEGLAVQACVGKHGTRTVWLDGARVPAELSQPFVPP